jgi:hypothetical protein
MPQLAQQMLDASVSSALLIAMIFIYYCNYSSEFLRRRIVTVMPLNDNAIETQYGIIDRCALSFLSEVSAGK